MLTASILVLAMVNGGLPEDPPLAFLRAALRETDKNEQASLINQGLRAITSADTKRVYSRDSHALFYLNLLTSDIPDFLKMDICGAIHGLGIGKEISADTQEYAIKMLREYRARRIEAGEQVPSDRPKSGPNTGPYLKDSQKLRQYIREIREFGKK